MRVRNVNKGNEYIRKIGGSQVDIAQKYYYLKKKQEQKNTNSDTNLRQELQEKIKKLAEEGKGILEIVEILKKDGKYNKYKQFFISYAENQVSKVRKAERKKEDEER